MAEECLICGAPLKYLKKEIQMECALCHKIELSSAHCEKGHYVCNECHTCASEISDLNRSMLSELADLGNSVAIRSYDPNLCDTFLHKSRPNGTEPVQVVRPGRFEENKPVELSDTGAVVLGKKEQLLSVLQAASAIKRLHRFSVRMQLIAAILAGVAIPALTLLGHLDAITPTVIAAYHLFWMLVNLIAARAELNADRLKLKQSSPNQDTRGNYEN